MSQHTPGPWFVKPAVEAMDGHGRRCQWLEYRISAGSTNGSAENYYRIGSVSNANDSDQNEANARLIAAAPELLEALLTADRTFAENGLLACHAARQEIRAAIAKATGQPNAQDPQGEKA